MRPGCTGWTWLKNETSWFQFHLGTIQLFPIMNYSYVPSYVLFEKYFYQGIRDFVWEKYFTKTACSVQAQGVWENQPSTVLLPLKITFLLWLNHIVIRAGLRCRLNLELVRVGIGDDHSRSYDRYKIFTRYSHVMSDTSTSWVCSKVPAERSLKLCDILNSKTFIF